MENSQWKKYWIELCKSDSGMTVGSWGHLFFVPIGRTHKIKPLNNWRMYQVNCMRPHRRCRRRWTRRRPTRRSSSPKRPGRRPPSRCKRSSRKTAARRTTPSSRTCQLPPNNQLLSRCPAYWPCCWWARHLSSATLSPGLLDGWLPSRLKLLFYRRLLFLDCRLLPSSRVACIYTFHTMMVFLNHHDLKMRRESSTDVSKAS